MKERIFIISTPSLVVRDAIGNEILEQKKTLEDIGFKVYLFSQFADHFFKKKILKENDFFNLIKNKSNILIFHYSIYWELSEKIFNLVKSKLIFRFHNFTPYSYFKFNEVERKPLYLTSLQLKSLFNLRKVDLILSCSKFNSKLIQKYLKCNIKILEIAPFHQLESITNHDIDNHKSYFDLKKILFNQKRNVLYVGRFQNHKGHLDLLESIYKYISFYDEEIYLNCVGKFKKSVITSIIKK